MICRVNKNVSVKVFSLHINSWEKAPIILLLLLLFFFLRRQMENNTGGRAVCLGATFMAFQEKATVDFRPGHVPSHLDKSFSPANCTTAKRTIPVSPAFLPYRLWQRSSSCMLIWHFLFFCSLLYFPISQVLLTCKTRSGWFLPSFI